ncbi:MAG: hypothetical protein ACM30I_14435 [Gemmatimonas sp.]
MDDLPQDQRRARILGGWHPDYPFAVITLRDHLYVRHRVFATCRSCRHAHALDLIGLAERYGPATPLALIVRRLKCTVCGSRDEPEITLSREPDE